MVWSVLQWIIISLVLIALIHYLYYFFKNTLTVPKIRDLVNKPTESYNEIMSTIHNNNKGNINNNVNNVNNNDDDSMQDELKSFLNELKKPKKPEGNVIESANDLSFSTTFANY